MPNNWITAWFIASFQFGLCLQRVCFLRNLNRCVIFYCILVGGRFQQLNQTGFFFGRPEVLEPQPRVPHLFWGPSYCTSPLHNLCKIWGFPSFQRWPCDSRTCNVGEILGTRCPLLRLCPFTHRSRAGAEWSPVLCPLVGWSPIKIGSVTQNPLAALGAF